MSNKSFGRTYFATSFLRSPGQSAQYEINRRILWYGVCLGAGTVAVISIILYGITTSYGYLLITPIGLITIVAMATMGGLISLRQIQLYWQGKEGEKITRDELEPLIKSGYRIFNDVPGDGFNIDFLIAGPAGLFIVEVKNPSKRDKSEEVKYESGLIWAGGRPLKDRNPVEQVKKTTDWLVRQLRDVGYKKLDHVKSVVLFPHFNVKEFRGDVWILNPKRFASEYLPKADKVLESHEVEALASIIQMHIKRKAETPRN